MCKHDDGLVVESAGTIRNGALVCLEEGPDCEGTVEIRMALSATGVSYPRCEFHWDKRLDAQAEIVRRYPVTAPADFDPSYAGESWDED